MDKRSWLASFMGSLFSDVVNHDDGLIDCTIARARRGPPTSTVPGATTMETQGSAMTAVKSEGHHGGDMISAANISNYNVTYGGEAKEESKDSPTSPPTSTLASGASTPRENTDCDTDFERER